MSYDISLWSVEPLRVPGSLPSSEEWQGDGTGVAYEKKTWRISIARSTPVLPEDVPEEVLPLLAGIRYLTEVTLEPIHADRSAYTFLHRVIAHIARDIRAVVVDPQTDSVTAPSGVKRYVQPRPTTGEERVDLLTLSWWFADGPLLTKEGLERLLGCLRPYLPEALPRRYGLYEPPAHRLEDAGEAHFVDFSDQNRDTGIVWYAAKPVCQVYLLAASDWGYTSLRGERCFRSNHFSLGIDSRVLRQPGWKEGVLLAWNRLSKVIRPFYGDVRTLRGYGLNRGTTWLDQATQRHPAIASWWAGVPRSLGHAVVVSRAYRDLWPSLNKAAVHEDDLSFVAGTDWERLQDLTSVIGAVPKDLAAPAAPNWLQRLTGKRGASLAERFPFPEPPAQPPMAGVPH